LRIAVVNDVKMIAEALRRILLASQHEIAWIAHDGAEAVANAANDVPDLILMDLLMPVMDGVEATRRIMQANPCPILVVTANVEGNSTEIFKAMSHGALDVVATPAMNPANTAPLLAKINTIARLSGKGGRRKPEPAPVPTSGAYPILVAIAASTGGPGALARLFAQLENIDGAAVVVIQHIDAQFAEGLAVWLSQQSKHVVKVAAEGGIPRPGEIFLAGTNDHLVLTSQRTFAYRSEPMDNPFRPSASVFFRSVAQNWSEPGIAVVLTGMGNDGADGLMELKAGGWTTIAQDETTSVIFGMPKAAAELGAVGRVLALERIAPAIDAQLSTMRVNRDTLTAERGGS
jgi:two-component system, chemotaxis family, response regulator WspF